MIIVVYISSNKNSNHTFLKDCFVALALKESNYKIIFFVDNTSTISETLPNNCSVLYLGKKPKINILLKYWYNYKLPAALKKTNAALFINTSAIVSNGITIPQFLYLNDIDLESNNYPFSTEIKNYYKKNTTQYLSNAAKLVVTTDAAKEKVVSTFPSLNNRVEVLSIAANNTFLPCSWEQQIELKNKFTNGKDYFLVNATFTTVEHFVNLLKAFTQFKKWQKSNLQILIVTTKNNLTPTLFQQLSNYKYKSDVQIFTDISLEDYTGILSAAYAFIMPYCTTNLPVQILEAMQCHIPVITQQSEFNKTIFKDAVCYANPIDTSEYSAKMILLYKDETYRTQLIQKSAEYASSFSIDQSVNTLTRILS